jgi:hypothetical protein
VPYVTDDEFHGARGMRPVDRLGGLVHEYRVAA